jgi:hypothetical protein
MGRVITDKVRNAWYRWTLNSANGTRFPSRHLLTLCCTAVNQTRVKPTGKRNPAPPDADETPLRRLRCIPAIIGLALARNLGHLLRCLAKELFILGKMV